ncbi:hypothetical protein ScPMuIL_004395 [Solemya velum]
MTAPSCAANALGIHSQRPKYPRYAVLAVRISSFENWPVYMGVTPQSLALAGLFYMGFGDNVKCFFCGGGLRNWEPKDIPWVEHARWYPRCAFLIQCQGLEFVQKVQHQSSGPNVQTAQQQTLGTNLYKTETLSVPRKPFSPRDGRDDSDPMTSVAAQSAIEMGYTEVTVKDAVRQLTQQTGSADFDAVTLVSLIMENEDEESQSQGSASKKHDTLDRTATYSHNSRSGDCPTSNSTRSNTDAYLRSLMEENRQMREESLCRICLEESSCVVFLPCGHMATCPRCAHVFQKCPVCRKNIQGTIKAYLS